MNYNGFCLNFIRGRGIGVGEVIETFRRRQILLFRIKLPFDVLFALFSFGGFSREWELELFINNVLMFFMAFSLAKL